MSKGALRVDKAIWELYEKIPHLLCEQPYGKNGRYITYYAEERLYLVFDLWYHGFFLVEANSLKDAIGEVNCDRLKYVPKEEEMTREEAIKILESERGYFCDFKGCQEQQALTIAIKALEKESKIEKVIKMRDATPEERESVDKYVKSISKPTGVDFWAIEHEPCEDCISRILKRMWNCRGEHTTSIDKVKMEQIIRDELLSVTPKPKTGHWIDKDEKSAVCSCCNKNNTLYGDFCKWCGAKMVESQERSD